MNNSLTFYRENIKCTMYIVHLHIYSLTESANSIAISHHVISFAKRIVKASAELRKRERR